MLIANFKKIQEVKMIQNLFLAVQQGSRGFAKQGGIALAFIRDTKDNVLGLLHHLTMTLGLGAIAILSVMFIKPDLAVKFKTLSPFSMNEELVEKVETPAVAPSLSSLMATEQQVTKMQIVDFDISANGLHAEGKTQSSQRQQAWVTNWLAKRYRVASDATNMLVSAAYLTAKEIKLDPLLILSVMAIESGLNPFAESPVGAQGLMQVMSKIHHEKFQDMGGIKAALNPVANIRVGALILKDYVTRGGSVEAGLKMYVGAAAFDTDSGYGYKVLAEYRRLKDVSSGKNVSIYATTPSAPIQVQPREASADIKLDIVTENKSIMPEHQLAIEIARL
jgi:hypothetical protein